LNFVTSGAEWMTRLISDLLDYSRVVRERTCLVRVDSQRLFDCALRNLRISTAEAGAIITREPLPKVLATAQLTLVFQNLIGNAIKYRAQAPPEVHIAAQSEDDGYWRFSVTDNGIGFDMAHADKLFNPFYRVRGKGACAGTGMGLAICHGIIHQIGGRIWAQSEPGKGSTFSFSVRAAPADIAAEACS
jgi:signal transduction histidine kinase